MNKYISFTNWCGSSDIFKRKDSLLLRIFSNNYLDKTEEFLKENLFKVNKVRNLCGVEGKVVDFLPATENFVGNTSHRLKIKYEDGRISNEYPEKLYFLLKEPI
jgi:hypothetical protein